MGKNFNIYRDAGGAKLYDAMMGTSLEKEIFGVVAGQIKDNLKAGKTRIVDLCCGTGIVSSMLPRGAGIEYTGIDISGDYIRSAKRKMKGVQGFTFIVGDALKYKPAGPFDMAVLTSAYHHIPDDGKSMLLGNIYDMLDSDGLLVMYEKAIRPYGTEQDRAWSNGEFYAARVKYLRELGVIKGKAFEALLNVADLSARAEDEYKVSHDYITKDLKSCGFGLVKELKVWPTGDVFGDEKIGDFVFVSRKYPQ